MNKKGLVGAGVAGVLVAVAVVVATVVLGGDGDEPEPRDTSAEQAEPQDQDASAGEDTLSLVAQARDGVTEVAVYDSADAVEPTEALSNPIDNGGPLVLLVDGQDADGDRIPVHLPIPPNGSTGWIDAADVSLYQHSFRITVDKAAHMLTLTEDGEEIFEAQVAVGQEGRETPSGVYYTKELLEPPDPNGVYGAFAYGLSGFTNNPDVAAQFGDGGVIGIHGTNEPERIGTDVSSGCIRMTNEKINELVNTINLPLGVPVEITG